MTAPRACRTCGARLPADVRWCLRCYAPAHELSPRAPLWSPGEFADTPLVTKGPVPHWSRWEKSVTTFGPVGRIGLTALASLWLLSAATRTPITVVFVLPLVVAIVRELWRPGWVIPADLAAPGPEHTPAPMRAWLWDRSDVVSSVLLAVAWIVGVGILVYLDSQVLRFVVIATGVVIGAFWIFRRISGGR